MKKPQRKPNRADVAKSLRELAILFGKKPPDRMTKACGNRPSVKLENSLREVLNE